MMITKSSRLILKTCIYISWRHRDISVDECYLSSVYFILISVLTDIIPQYKEVHDFWLSNSRPDTLSVTIPDFSKALYHNYNDVIEEQYSIKSDKGWCVETKIHVHVIFRCGYRISLIFVPPAGTKLYTCTLLYVS